MIFPSLKFTLQVIVRRKSHIGWKWSTDFFCRLIRVYKGLRQYFSEGVQNFFHWHLKKIQYGRRHTLISLK